MRASLRNPIWNNAIKMMAFRESLLPSFQTEKLSPLNKHWDNCEFISTTCPTFPRWSAMICVGHALLDFLFAFSGLERVDIQESLALELGYRESTESWSGVLSSFHDNRTDALLPMVGDGALGQRAMLDGLVHDYSLPALLELPGAECADQVAEGAAFGGETQVEGDVRRSYPLGV